MIKLNKKLILPVFVLTFVGLTLFGSSQVYAQGIQGNISSLVQKLAQKFGLNTADVQSVFDEVRNERQSEMQAKFEEQLSQDVKDGKLTEDQKKLILAKHQELLTNKGTKPDNWQNMTPEERRTWMQTQKTELETWAKDNGIDLKYFFGGMRSKGQWFNK